MIDRQSGGSSTVDARIQGWLAQAWDPTLSLLEWRTRLVDGGWACPSWPMRWGGMGLSAPLADRVADTLAQRGVPGAPESVGLRLVAPTLLEHGSDNLKARMLRSTATGEIVWCQLFSEPGAGSDLASLTTRAERDGDEWVITGQKVWSTGAAQADFGILLARTNWEVPKHQGITYFVLPMRQHGVEVRPLRQMNGHASFNEVFLDEARLPLENVVGELGQGWQVARTTLAHERRLAFPLKASMKRELVGRAWREALAERRDISEPHKWYPQRAGRVDLLVEGARAMGRNHEPVIRQEMSKVISIARTSHWTAQRAGHARVLGRHPGPEGSVGKLMTSTIAQAASRTHSAIAGASGMLAGPDAPVDGLITEIFVSVPAQSIAGGTDEIQRNIIAERILGLPKEPSASLILPFRQESKNS